MYRCKSCNSVFEKNQVSMGYCPECGRDSLMKSHDTSIIITTKDDETRSIIESNALSVESRFKTMKKLSHNKIFTGTVFMPIIPFIYDDEENIELVIKKTKDSGGHYILDGGLTIAAIRDYCKQQGAKNVYTAVLVEKQKKREPGGLETADVHGLLMGDQFVFGYGLDYDEYLRNAPGIYAVAAEHA